MKNVEFMVLGTIVISATKTLNARVTPFVKLIIWIFVGMNYSCLLPNFFNVVDDMIIKIAPYLQMLWIKFYHFIEALTYKGFKCLVISSIG